MVSSASKWQDQIKQSNKFGKEHNDTNYFKSLPLVEQCEERPRITQVKVFEGKQDSFIFGIQVFYSVGSERKETQKFIGNHTNQYKEHSFVIEDGDFLNQIWGNSGGVLDQLCLGTSKGKTAKYGGDGGVPGSLQTPKNCEIIGITVGVGGHVHNISCNYMPALQTNSGGSGLKDQIYNLLDKYTDGSKAYDFALQAFRFAGQHLQEENLMSTICLVLTMFYDSLKLSGSNEEAQRDKINKQFVEAASKVMIEYPVQKLTEKWIDLKVPYNIKEIKYNLFEQVQQTQNVGQVSAIRGLFAIRKIIPMVEDKFKNDMKNILGSTAQVSVKDLRGDAAYRRVTQKYVEDQFLQGRYTKQNFLEFKRKVQQSNPGVTSDQAYYQLLDFVFKPTSQPFRIYDLIRCRQSYKTLEDLVEGMNQFNQQYKIVLCRDKLNTPLSLVHVNFEYNFQCDNFFEQTKLDSQSFIGGNKTWIGECQFVLSQEGINEKLNKFSHQLYEIKRSDDPTFTIWTLSAN